MDPRSKGQSMVEFALIFPLLLLVLLSLIDGALLMQGYLAVNHAAREAARFAIAYQPNQGECLDNDGDGVGTDEPWPYCPNPGYGEDPYESDADYQSRRVRLIKMRASEEARGLRMSTLCTDVPSTTCIDNHTTEEGMFGVQVWGLPSFEDPAQEDHPGLRGLTVRVRVVHNVPLTVFAPLLPNDYVRVGASAEMINEGVQVGYGNLAPPTIGAPTIDPDTTPQNTVTPVDTPTTGPSPTPTPLPVYNIDLDFETATNLLPEEREHNFGARVTNPQGQNIGGAQVTFRTDEGSFVYSGTGAQVQTLSTSADGWARLSVYANEPTTAHIEAWLDYDGDLIIDDDEPSDTATKIWEATGPYLVVTNHEPEPAEVIGVHVMDHPPSGNSHSLLWCPAAVTSTQISAQVAYPV
ncbi:MAG: TadE/TadG family type IV pilus assembly protein, partial [Anaerolineae bacterium]